MLVKVDRDNDAARVIFEGRVTEESFGELRLHMAKLELGNVKELILDLGLVQSVNSSGLSQLAALNKKLGARAVKVSLVEVPEKIYDLLTAIKIQELISMTPKNAR